MKQEDKQLLLADLCGRVPYHPKGYVANSSTGAMCDEWLTCATFPMFTNVTNNCRLYLRPMSSMTDDEAKEIAILHDIKDILSVKVTSDYIDVIVDDGVCSTERRTIWYDEIVSSIKCFDWLNAHHFDFRNLIPMGLAIAVTEENNPYKE